VLCFGVRLLGGELEGESGGGGGNSEGEGWRRLVRGRGREGS